MPLVTYTTPGGATMRWMEIDGRKYTYMPGANQETSLEAIRHVKARDDDVILVNFNKSGTHWLWEIICMLYNGSAETIKTIKQKNMLEALSVQQLDAMPSPRILNTHFRFDRLPSDMIAKRTKIVLIHRNPKDIAVSMYNHHVNLTGLYDYEGTWEDYLPNIFLPGNFDCGSWFDYVLDWERVMKENTDYPIHLMFYEGLKEDSVREIVRLVSFLGVPAGEALCAAVADKCRFENMARDKRGLEDEYWTCVWRDRRPAFYRKGQVGDWKNWFTVAQNEMFDTWYQEKMADSKLKIRFEL